MKRPSGNGGGNVGLAPIHLEFIQNQAELRNGDGLDDVESFHRAVFLHHHADELERARQQAVLHANRLRHLERRLAQRV